MKSIRRSSLIAKAVQGTHPKHTFGESVRFGFVGVMNTGVDFAVFYLLAHFAHFGVVTAQGISYACGLTNSYLWNRWLTFASTKQPHVSEVFRFVLVSGVSYAASVVVLLLLQKTTVPLTLSKLLVIVVTLAINFVGSKWFVFRKSFTSHQQQVTHRG